MLTNTKRSGNLEITLDDRRQQLIDDAWRTDETVETPVYIKRKSAGLWTAVAVLAAALAVVSGYGYWILCQNGQQLAQLPSMTRSIEAVGSRLIGVENKLSAVKSDEAALSAKTAQLNQSYSSEFERAHAYSHDLVASLNSQLQRELEKRTQYFQTELAEREFDQRQEQLQLSELKKELANTREQLASVNERYTNQMAVLRRAQADSENRIDSLNSMLATDQVNFKLQKGREQEIVPGVSLRLTNMDVRHQSFDGWIWFSDQKPMIRIHDQGIQQPVVFYPSQNDEAYKLIVTQVRSAEVVGYLYVPAKAEVQQTVLQGDRSSVDAAQPSF